VGRFIPEREGTEKRLLAVNYRPSDGVVGNSRHKIYCLLHWRFEGKLHCEAEETFKRGRGSLGVVGGIRNRPGGDRRE